MNLNDLTPGDYFYSDTGIKWQYLKMSVHEKKTYPDRYKALRTDTNEIFYTTNILIRKNK